MPRAFSEGQSIARRLFWLAVTALGFLAFAVFGGSAIQSFQSHETSYNSFDRPVLTGRLPAFPAVTICPIAPISCQCRLWYEDLVLDNLDFTYPLTSFWYVPQGACPTPRDIHPLDQCRQVPRGD
jgi:hypothetical protein